MLVEVVLVSHLHLLRVVVYLAKVLEWFLEFDGYSLGGEVLGCISLNVLESRPPSIRVELPP